MRIAGGCLSSRGIKASSCINAAGRGEEIVVRANQIEQNACVLPIDRFYSAIEDSFVVDAQTLTQLASVCMKRLGNMAARSSKVLPA